ncbi:hypothetical protein DID88_008089 [Monilinia fructigena]|uniref:Uncharacterized protein n=1 Tax=Monilinia fructigena TaxID=38457 RepID=A0A395J9D5_9HELO|nr:hypothetical protein DID88_008089 [Monilinia fructigena]
MEVWDQRNGIWHGRYPAKETGTPCLRRDGFAKEWHMIVSGAGLNLYSRWLVAWLVCTLFGMVQFAFFLSSLMIHDEYTQGECIEGVRDSLSSFV